MSHFVGAFCTIIRAMRVNTTRSTLLFVELERRLKEAFMCGNSALCRGPRPLRSGQGVPDLFSLPRALSPTRAFCSLKRNGTEPQLAQ
jgi:hypothetical protein